MRNGEGFGAACGALLASAALARARDDERRKVAARLALSDWDAAVRGVRVGFPSGYVACCRGYLQARGWSMPEDVGRGL